MKRTINPVFERMKTRLVLKYLIYAETAVVWIEEFHKFLLILVYLDKEISAFIPSPILKMMWNTYREFTQVWTNLCDDLLV